MVQHSSDRPRIGTSAGRQATAACVRELQGLVARNSVSVET